MVKCTSKTISRNELVNQTLVHQALYYDFWMLSEWADDDCGSAECVPMTALSEYCSMITETGMLLVLNWR